MVVNIVHSKYPKGTSVGRTGYRGSLTTVYAAAYLISFPEFSRATRHLSVNLPGPSQGVGSHTRPVSFGLCSGVNDLAKFSKKCANWQHPIKATSMC